MNPAKPSPDPRTIPLPTGDSFRLRDFNLDDAAPSPAAVSSAEQASCVDPRAATSYRPAMELLGVHHVSLNVSDLDQTVRFYTDVLGLPLLERPELRVDGAWLGLPDGREVHLIVSDVPEAKGQHFAFEVASVSDTISHLTAAGHSPSPAGAIDGVCNQTFCADPSGNLVEFNERM